MIFHEFAELLLAIGARRDAIFGSGGADLFRLDVASHGGPVGPSSSIDTVPPPPPQQILSAPLGVIST